MGIPEFTLYLSTFCPFCIKVRFFMEQHGIELPVKNVGDQVVYSEELKVIGGKTQVPCLVIDGKALYESDDIINWLQENWKPEWTQKT